MQVGRLPLNHLQYGLQDIRLLIGIWTGFDFEEEREMVRGTVDGDLKHDF
jgi:hypothetical protein